MLEEGSKVIERGRRRREIPGEIRGREEIMLDRQGASERTCSRGRRWERKEPRRPEDPTLSHFPDEKTKAQQISGRIRLRIQATVVVKGKRPGRKVENWTEKSKGERSRRETEGETRSLAVAGDLSTQRGQHPASPLPKWWLCQWLTVSRASYLICVMAVSRDTGQKGRMAGMWGGTDRAFHFHTFLSSPGGGSSDLRSETGCQVDAPWRWAPWPA